jgi:hypothetical protein
MTLIISILLKAQKMVSHWQQELNDNGFKRLCRRKGESEEGGGKFTKK